MYISTDKADVGRNSAYDTRALEPDGGGKRLIE